MAVPVLEAPSESSGAQSLAWRAPRGSKGPPLSLSVITQSEIRNKKCSRGGWAIPTVTCHGAEHVWVDVTSVDPWSTTHALLLKLLYFEVSKSGGGRPGVQLLKGARPKMGRRFDWTKNCREAAGELSEAV